MWVDLHSWDCGPQTLDHASEERKTHWFLMIWTCFKRVKKFVYQRAKKLHLDSRQMVAKALKHFMLTSGFSYDFFDGAQRHIARSSSTMGEAKRLFRREKKEWKKRCGRRASDIIASATWLSQSVPLSQSPKPSWWLKMAQVSELLQSDMESLIRQDVNTGLPTQPRKEEAYT